MQLLVNRVLLVNQLLCGILSAPIVQLGNIATVGGLVFHVPWAHTVIKAMPRAQHVKRIASLVKDHHSVSPAHPDWKHSPIV